MKTQYQKRKKKGKNNHTWLETLKQCKHHIINAQAQSIQEQPFIRLPLFDPQSRKQSQVFRPFQDMALTLGGNGSSRKGPPGSNHMAHSNFRNLPQLMGLLDEIGEKWPLK